MHFSAISRFLLTCLAAITAGCVNYASVLEKKPTHEACTLESCTLAGRRIMLALEKPYSDPLARIGRYLDAAAMAARAMQSPTPDPASMVDYNFATSRIFEVIHKHGLQPGPAPLICPGEGKSWKFSLKADAFPRDDLSHFQLQPADRYEFRGTLVRKRTVKPGAGSPLIATSRTVEATEADPFTLNRKIYYGVTGVLAFKGDVCTASCLDPLGNETVSPDGKTYPLAADFTAPLALGLAEMKLHRHEIRCFVRPGGIDCNMRLARLQPYDPKKIPVLFIHGLGNSEATWTLMIESLRNDPVIRHRYQFRVFGYPTGYPYPLTAANLRIQLDAAGKAYPDHKKMIVIGHSMGAMISRTLMTDSGMKLWDAYYDQPPSKVPLAEDTRRSMMDSLIFQHRPDLARVIFMSGSHRGSDAAVGFLGRLGAGIISRSTSLPALQKEAAEQAKPAALSEQLHRMTSSIDVLDPKNEFVTTIDTLPLAKGIPYHSIIGDRGKGGNPDRTKPVSTDGIVPYWSSHMEGAESEHVIPGGHWSNQHPQGIAEVRRILRQHVGAPLSGL